MYVAIDTNVLPNGWRFRSRIVRDLVEFLRETQSTLLLSEVVTIEAAATYERSCTAALGTIENALQSAKDLFIDVEEFDKASALSAAVASHERAVAEELPDTVRRQLPID